MFSCKEFVLCSSIYFEKHVDTTNSGLKNHSYACFSIFEYGKFGTKECDICVAFLWRMENLKFVTALQIKNKLNNPFSKVICKKKDSNVQKNTQ